VQSRHPARQAVDELHVRFNDRQDIRTDNLDHHLLAMGGLPVEAWFDDFSVEPLASASIAQVHTARLKGRRPSGSSRGTQRARR
jgi:hypothetical protein